MAIRFLNIRSGEEAVAEDEPQIAALWASSDRSPNITQGQDFGWRIAPARSEACLRAPPRPQPVAPSQKSVEVLCTKPGDEGPYAVLRCYLQFRQEQTAYPQSAIVRMHFQNQPLAFFAALASHRSRIASVLSGKLKPQFTPMPSPGHIYTTRAGASNISSPLRSKTFTFAPGGSGCSVSM